MQVAAMFANLNCSDLQRSTRWFKALFGRAPDACPMPGLAEWHQAGGGGLQLFENADGAGKGTLTLHVRNLGIEYRRLARMSKGRMELSENHMVVRLRDPDGNLVVLADPPESRGAARADALGQDGIQRVGTGTSPR